MSLLQNLATRALRLEASAGDDSSWIDALLEDAEQLPLDGTPQIVRDAAVSAILEHRDELARVGAGAVAEIVWHLALGRDDAAELVYLATSATAGEREAALDAAFARTQKHRADWAERRALFVAIVRGFGAAALPLILAAL